jgi:hypothetical protein
MEVKTALGLMLVYIVMILAFFFFGWELQQLFHAEEEWSGFFLPSLNVNVGYL